jgi:hypothetical protein
MSCLLWEDSFYESGEDIAKRIAALVPLNRPEDVATLALEARSHMKLRHAPLLLVREMARTPSHRSLVASTLFGIIQRADELAEFLSIYWRDDKNQSLSAQVKKGLAMAFRKFDEYALAKYNRDADVKLRDVLFLCHAKPENTTQEKLWKKLVDDKLAIPDTWETKLSAGADKAATFTRLIKEEQLGALALLRNLRGMTEAGVDRKVIVDALGSMKTERVLPFRFIAAARHAPQFEPQLEEAMFRCCDNLPKLPGKTVFVVDISGSMESGRVSSKSDLTRVDAANALAILIREMAEDPVIYATAGDDYRRIHATSLVPSRRGFALSDAIWSLNKTLGGGGIFLAQCLQYISEKERSADRVIVLTDEQDCDLKCDPKTANAFGKTNYIINVSNEKNGIAYDKFTHIDGWSESVVRFISELEKS